MKRKKIVIHLGLPKTATTTLQHHLFQKLHDLGNINFLGKAVEYDKDGKPYFKNNIGGIIRDVCEEKLPLTSDIDSFLHPDLINVFSDEGIMVCYPFRENIPLERKINNLRALLVEYDVKILLSLRNPVDYFTSLYVQFYPEYYQSKKEFNTFSKYIDIFLSKPNDLLFESFHYLTIMNLIISRFDTKVIFYEDLRHDNKKYFKALANILSVSESLVEGCLENRHENNKRTKSNLKITSFNLSGVVPKVVKLFSNIPFVYAFAKYLYNIKLLNSLLYKNIGMLEKRHLPPTKDEVKILEDILLIPNDFSLGEFPLDRQKLIEYGYLKTRG